MSYEYPLCTDINLHVPGRISPEDAQRQERTARAILERLRQQPGVVLADEVGMGKTFVALAVGASVALANRRAEPVVVMVPPSLKDKWPADFQLFCEKCLPPALAKQVQYGRAERAVEFLKLLDDPPQRRCSIIFATHGAMSRGLMDKWVMLALIYQTLKHRWGSRDKRRNLSRFLASLLHMGWVEAKGQDIWEDLLSTPPANWLEVLNEWEIDPEGDDDPSNNDDPVPQAICDVLPTLNTDAILEALDNVPQRKSKHFKRHLVQARQQLKAELRTVWRDCLAGLRLRLPLLILDEAHHLKNARTKLASLFQVSEAHEDAEEITRGPLGGVFQRMLFLTATPFQLGHSELCSVLDRFNGICWRGAWTPPDGHDAFKDQLRNLRTALDAAQESAVSLDHAWGRLQPADLRVGDRHFDDVAEWWAEAQTTDDLMPTVQTVVRCYQRTRQRMHDGGTLLKPWVIRHMKPRNLPEPHSQLQRRHRFPGRAIDGAGDGQHDGGLPVGGTSLLPFLLAARASSHAPKSRPVFAEGLASSYEAYLHTRRLNQLAKAKAGTTEGGATDEDDDVVVPDDATDAMRWYLDQLETLIPQGDATASASHPKIASTVRRVVDIWSAGEKAVVFCHYVATGRTLRSRISDAIDQQVCVLGSRALGCEPDMVLPELERLGNRFFDEDSPVRRACDLEAGRLLDGFPELAAYRDVLVDIVRRNVRTPSFLVRFFPLDQHDRGERAMIDAMDKPDQSGLTLRGMLESFFSFLVERCGEADRRRYIDEVSRVQVGTHTGRDLSRIIHQGPLFYDLPVS